MRWVWREQRLSKGFEKRLKRQEDVSWNPEEGIAEMKASGD